MLEPKAKYISYWSGVRRTKENASSIFDIEFEGDIFPLDKRGPSRKLTLEQEFLLVMMRLCLNLLIKYLAFRFGVADSRVTQVLITWIRLLSRQLGLGFKGSNISLYHQIPNRKFEVTIKVLAHSNFLFP